MERIAPGYHAVVRLLAGALVAWLWTCEAAVPPLQPRGYTNDYSGVLGAAAVRAIDTLAGEVERKTKAQIAVVVVRTLDGEPIEDYANTLARRWGIGGKEQRGVMLLLAIDERRSRLEVGYGLEPILPDGRVGAILRSMRARLREGDYDGAVLSGVGELAAVIAQASGVELEARLPRRSGRSLPMSGWGIGSTLALFALFALLSGWGRRGRRRGLRTGGGFFPPLWIGSTGGGGSKWDGGGFSGFGGGDFGGGGASSDW